MILNQQFLCIDADEAVALVDIVAFCIDIYLVIVCEMDEAWLLLLSPVHRDVIFSANL